MTRPICVDARNYFAAMSGSGWRGIGNIYPNQIEPIRALDALIHC
jgi:hypothetical protein